MRDGRHWKRYDASIPQYLSAKLIAKRIKPLTTAMTISRSLL
jgi:hypothetical protein